MIDWTERRVALLTQAWREGKTASRIAEMLGGISRDAVIGKAHRLGLVKRMSPVRPKGKWKKRDVRRMDPTPSRESDARAALPKLPRPPVAAPRLAVAGNGTCQWLDGQRPSWRKCGAPAVDGAWCAEHYARVFQQKPLARL